MTRPTPNVPLLRKVMDHIEAHPEEWWQDDWMSVAVLTPHEGAYVHAHHGNMQGDADIDTWRDIAEQYPDRGIICNTAYCFAGHAIHMMTNDKFISGTELVQTEHGDQVEVANRACELLGLTIHQGAHLFQSSNTMPRLRTVVEEIIADPKMYTYEEI